MKAEIKNAEHVKKIILLLKDKYLTMRSGDINQDLMGDQHWKYLTMRSAGICALTEVLYDDPSLAKDVLEQIIPLLKDSNNDVRDLAIEALSDMIKTDPSLAKEVFKQIIPLLKDDYTRDSAIATLQVISKISSEYDVFYN